MRFIILTFLFLVPLSSCQQQPIDTSPPFAGPTPTPAAPPMTSFRNLATELSVWGDTSLFYALISTLFPDLRKFLADPSQTKLVFAPTNTAFLTLFARLLRAKPGLPNEKALVQIITNPMNIAQFLKTAPQLLTDIDLPRVLRYHVVAGNWPEVALRSTKFVVTASGDALNVTSYPNITDVDARTDVYREYRQINASTGAMVFVSHVMLPYNLSKILNESSDAADIKLPDLNIPLVPRLRSDLAESNANLISRRTDLNFLSTFARLFPRVATFLTFGETHVFAPTDAAFIKLFEAILGTVDDPVSDFVESIASLNISQFAGMISVFASKWDKISGLPGLESVLLYHISSGRIPYEQLVGTTVKTLYPNATLKVLREGVQDVDDSRPLARRWASYETRRGYVTVVDGVLTPFNVKLAKIIVGVGITPSDEPDKPEDDEKKENVTSRSGACFPAEAEIFTRRGRIRMEHLEAGDEVLTKMGNEPVFMFTHRISHGLYPFIRLFTSKRHIITLSHGHILSVNNQLHPAADVKPGDMLTTMHGDVIVIKREVVWRRGLYAPHVAGGEMIVDGVLVSCYTTAVSWSLAHALLTPLRSLAKSLGVAEVLCGWFYETSWLGESLLAALSSG